MLLTVAICTWNRAKLLDQTLASLARLVPPAGYDWEVVLVDNNCTDDTAAVADRRAGRLPLRRVVETQQGHSHARNRAVAEARGDLVVWTDDDVQVSDRWLAEYARVAAEYPDAAYFGGPITRWFADDVPPAARAMVEANLELLAGVYALRDYGPVVRPFAAGEVPFGANMGFRTEVLRKYPFDPRLGRVKTGLIGADEVSVLDQVRAAGHPGVWIGTAPVRHHIPADRTTRGHFWRFFHGVGRTQARMDGVPAAATLFGRPRWLLKAHLAARAKGFVGRALGRPGWLADYLTAAKLAGYLEECAAATPAAGYLVPPYAPAPRSRS
jgi:hypothetical protein